MNNMVSVPTKFATLVFANVMEMSRTALAVERLKSTSVSMNFQKMAGSETSPTRGYTMAPNTRGGTIRSGRISKRILKRCLISHYVIKI